MLTASADLSIAAHRISQCTDRSFMVCVTMAQEKTALERAFELARSGYCTSIEEIRRVLRSEGYSDEQVVGKALVEQLREIIEAARKR